jgi:hypothetical protein
VPEELSQNFIFSPNRHRGQLALKKTINSDYIHTWFRAVVEEIQRSQGRREKSLICPCLPPPPIFLQTAIILALEKEVELVNPNSGLGVTPVQKQCACGGALKCC